MCTYMCVFAYVCVCESFKPAVTSKYSHTLTAAHKVTALSATPNIADREHVKREENLDALPITFRIESLVKLSSE